MEAVDQKFVDLKSSCTVELCDSGYSFTTHSDYAGILDYAHGGPCINIKILPRPERRMISPFHVALYNDGLCGYAVRKSDRLYLRNLARYARMDRNRERSGCRSSNALPYKDFITDFNGGDGFNSVMLLHGKDDLRRVDPLYHGFAHITSTP